MSTGWQNFLELETEVVLHGFPGTDKNGLRLEASGVCVYKNSFVVVCDDRPGFIRVGADLSPSHQDNTASWLSSDRLGFEDIAWSENSQCFYALIEAEKRRNHEYQPRIETYNQEFQLTEKARWIDLELKSKNKGLEGITCVQHNGQEYLFGLCEGNDCKKGKAGAAPGTGRLIVFQRAGKEWVKVKDLNIPMTAFFEDYAAVDIRDQRVLVVSQASSAVWVGTIDLNILSFVGQGAVWNFPPGDGEEKSYCNVEGAAWIGQDRIVAVSDKRKATDPHSCEERERMIHIFRFPAGFSPA